MASGVCSGHWSILTISLGLNVLLSIQNENDIGARIVVCSLSKYMIDRTIRHLSESVLLKSWFVMHVKYLMYFNIQVGSEQPK